MSANWHNAVKIKKECSSGRTMQQKQIFGAVWRPLDPEGGRLARVFKGVL